MKNYTKKIIGFFTICTVLLITSCKDQPAEKEVVILPAAAPVVIEKEVPASSTTSITLDKNGLEVDADKIDVKIEK